MVALSIVVPVYNGELHLHECLESLRQQTWQDLEVVVVDDGSTDATCDVAAAFCDRDQRFRYVAVANGGSSAARNAGIDLAKGVYIGFVDADDWVDEGMFERLLQRALSGNLDVVAAELQFVREADHTIETFEMRGGEFTRADIEALIFPVLATSTALTRPWPYRIVTKVFRSELIESRKIRFAEGLRAAQDFTFSVEVMVYAHTFFYDRGFAPYFYRWNPDSRTNTPLTRSFENYRHVDEELDRILGDDPKFHEQLALSALQGDLSALTYQYRGRTLREWRLLRKELEAQLDQLDRSAAFTALDWGKIPISKRIVCALMRRRNLGLLHSLLMLRGARDRFKDNRATA